MVNVKLDTISRYFIKYIPMAIIFTFVLLQFGCSLLLLLLLLFFLFIVFFHGKWMFVHKFLYLLIRFNVCRGKRYYAMYCVLFSFCLRHFMLRCPSHSWYVYVANVSNGKIKTKAYNNIISMLTKLNYNIHCCVPFMFCFVANPMIFEILKNHHFSFPQLYYTFVKTFE